MKYEIQILNPRMSPCPFSLCSDFGLLISRKCCKVKLYFYKYISSNFLCQIAFTMCSNKYSDSQNFNIDMEPSGETTICHNILGN